MNSATEGGSLVGLILSFLFQINRGETSSKATS